MGGLELATIAKDYDILIGPAHAFTPWTAMYAYHPTLDDCYGELSNYVSFVELGLSADTNYADTIHYFIIRLYLLIKTSLPSKSDLS